MPTTSIGAARKATVQRARLRAAFCGPSKSGKTYVSLVTMKSLIDTLRDYACLQGNGRCVLIDSEGGRGEDYGELFDYDIYDLASYSPEAYIDAIRLFVNEGYSGIIVDQISHEWDGKGGAIEINSTVTRESSSKNSWAAWDETSPRHRNFTEALVRCPTHLICTMRVKTDWMLQTNDRGKLEPVKLGLAPIQRKSTEYEFDILGTIDMSHAVKLETRGTLSDLLGDRTLMPGPKGQSKDAGEVADIGKLVGKWIAGHASAADLGLVSREQINEIQSYGERLGFTHEHWKKIFAHYKISSLSRMTPEIYAIERASMSTAIAEREAKIANKKNSNHHV